MAMVVCVSVCVSVCVCVSIIFLKMWLLQCHTFGGGEYIMVCRRLCELLVWWAVSTLIAFVMTYEQIAEKLIGI